MKQVLATKSKNDLVLSILFVLVTSVLLTSVFYLNLESTSRGLYLFLLIGFGIILCVSILKMIKMILLPKIMMWHDDNYIYFCQNKYKEQKILFSEIQSVYLKVKAFSIFASIGLFDGGDADQFQEIVIKTTDKIYFVSHVSKIREVHKVIKDYMDIVSKKTK